MCPVRYATRQSEPPIDASSQLTQEMAINSDGMMRMQFMRPIISNDSQVSIIIMYLITTCLYMEVAVYCQCIFIDRISL